MTRPRHRRAVPRSRRIAYNICAGAAVTVLVLGIVVVVRGSGSSGHNSSLRTVAPSPGTTPSTFELVPLPSVPPPPTTGGSTTTVADGGAAPQPSIPDTSTTEPSSPVSGAGAILAPPRSPDRRPFAAGASCQSLADPGWGRIECGPVAANGATLIWLIESDPGGSPPTSTTTTTAPPGSPSTTAPSPTTTAPAPPAGPERALLFRSDAKSGMADLILQAVDDGASRFTGITTRVVSVAGDGFDDLAFGFHQKGNVPILSVDLVHGSGAVVVHEDLSRGAVRLASGQMDAWSALYPTAQASCCPQAYDHATVRLTPQGWRSVSDASVPPSSVPPSEL